jgi:hypothetical protein
MRQQDSWFRAVTRFASRIRKRFGVPDQGTEERMVRVFRAALRPRKKAGRKPDKATARAAEMWITGMEYNKDGDRATLCHYQRALWQRIYRDVLPDFSRMDKLARQYRTCMLRRNVKAFLRRQGWKSSQGFRVGTGIHSRKGVLFPASATPSE